MKIRNCLKGQRGVSLAELLVVVALLWIVVGSIYGLLEVGYADYEIGEKQMDAQMNARLAIDRLVNEIRQAREGNNGAFAFEKVRAQAITFYADVDSASSGAERVTYFVPQEGDEHESELRRSVTPASGNPPTYDESDEVATTVAKYVQNGDNSMFTYFGEDYKGSEGSLQSPVNPVDVTLIRIRLIVDVNPGEKPEGFDLQSSVQVRNLKTNLGD